MDKYNNTIIESQISDDAKLFAGIRIVNSVIGSKATIGDDCDIVNLKAEEKTEFGRRNIIRDTIMGRCSYTGTNTIIKNADIGNFCCIAWNVSIGGGNHDYHNTSLYTDYWFNRNFGIESPKPEAAPIRTVIGNDVWIGAGAIINNGVTIGNGSVIGAGAVIVKDIPSWSIVVGTPGKIIRKRFEDDIANSLEMLKWWNWDDEMIVKYHDFLASNPTIEEMEKIKKDINNAEELKTNCNY